MIAYRVIIPLGLFTLLAPLTPSLDLAFGKFFATSSISTWPIWKWLYTYGIYPAWIVAALCVIALFFKKLRKPALVYLLTYGIGSGIITHVLLKNFWHRPRPIQTLELGGSIPYHPFWKPLFGSAFDDLASFPCGHCTVGFVFFGLCIAGARMKNRLVLAIGVVLTIILGLGLTIARMAVLGHYFSDALAACLIMWLSALLSEYVVYRSPCMD